MGLPRASGKRRWSGEDGEETLPAAKVICTSPPHALCAEDVLHHPALTHAHANTPAIECELTSGEATGDPSTTRLEPEELPPTTVPGNETHCLPAGHTFPEEESDDDDSDDDHDDFIDDEEDKDSGFIDSNSIDNSSDDEVENRVISGDAGEACPSSTSSPSSTTTTSTTTASTSLQLSLSKVLSPVSTSPQETPSVVPPLTMSQVPILLPSPPLPLTVYTPTLSSLVTCTTIPVATTNTSPSSPVVVQAPMSPGHTTTVSPPPPPIPSIPTTTFLLSSVSTITTTCTTTTTTATSTTGTTADEAAVAGPKILPSEGSITTVTATQTGTVVTSTYQGALTSPVYDPHPFTYSGESYPTRPSTPTWESCNYYDGSQPTTNKYMEISPNKPSSSQSIQCDENGKSYLELGSASPYTHTYSSDCGNYTTSPSSYPAQSYNQTYTSPSSYGQPNSYYGPRQSYSPGPYAYPTGENYSTFEGENGCSYTYGGSGYGGVRGGLLPARGPPRCMSPYCDPTRGSPRPSCYQQQRLSVLNMSMYKLNRFRQFPDPSLHRSVLICNTLRHIERELEAEGVSVASLLAHSHGHPAHPHLQGATLGPGSPPCPDPMPSSSPSPAAAGEAAEETPLSPMHTPLVGSPLAAPSSPPPSTPGSPPPATHYTTPMYPAPQYLPSDHASGSYDNSETVHMRTYPDLVDNSSHEESQEESTSSVTEEADSTEEESSPSTPPPRPVPPSPEDRTDAINWCSVLSLSSQTDLDSMNNNEYGEWSNETTGDLDYNRPEDGPPWKLPSLSAEDVLKSFPEASKRLESNEDLDSIINVLVGS